ncbi:hypothetical protein QPK87_38625 [Kamptonema cortianum]|nr:hypothetical protein [Geitlerinema splendidum]MDK3162419.1 hypothetical protein [Kamptonema cortianum]
MSDHHDHREERDYDLLEELGYEPTDTAAESPVGAYTLYFFGFLIVMMAASWAFLTVADRVSGYKFTQANQERAVMPPPGTPLIQSDATAERDMHEVRKQEEEKLSTVKWNDDSRTSATIPIEDAKRIVARRGLPTRANPGVPEDAE